MWINEPFYFALCNKIFYPPAESIQHNSVIFQSFVHQLKLITGLEHLVIALGKKMSPLLINQFLFFFCFFFKSSLITTSSDKQVVLIDEYNPLRPNEYSDFKQRAREREERERREKREREERDEDRRDRRFVFVLYSAC